MIIELCSKYNFLNKFTSHCVLVHLQKNFYNFSQIIVNIHVVLRAFLNEHR